MENLRLENVISIIQYPWNNSDNLCALAYDTIK